VWSAKLMGCDCKHKQGCCQLGLQSQHWCRHHAQGSAGVQKLMGVTAVTDKAVVSLGCRASTGVDIMHRVLSFVSV